MGPRTRRVPLLSRRLESRSGVQRLIHVAVEAGDGLHEVRVALRHRELKGETVVSPAEVSRMANEVRPDHVDEAPAIPLGILSEDGAGQRQDLIGRQGAPMLGFPKEGPRAAAGGLDPGPSSTNPLREGIARHIRP